MTMHHSSFIFGLHTLLQMCILLHLSIANKCTIVVSEEHEMSSFIQTEQCVNVAYLYGQLVANNNKMNLSLQCYSVLSDILVKHELCTPLERGSNVLSTGEGFICLSPPIKLKIAVRFCSIYIKRFRSVL